MRAAKRRDRDGVVDAAGADVGRRRLLLGIVGLPFAGSAVWALGACSPGEDARPRGGSESGAPPAAPRPAAAAPAPPQATPGPAAAEKAGGPPGGSGAGTATGDALVTEIDAMKPTVQALQYVHASTKPDQLCSSCQFYTAKSAERGSCQLFVQGLVEAGGWCSSWTKRATGA